MIGKGTGAYIGSFSSCFYVYLHIPYEIFIKNLEKIWAEKGKGRIFVKFK